MFEQLFNIDNYRYNIHAIPLIIAGVLILIIGAFILFQAKKEVKNIAFFLFCLSLSFWLNFSGLVYLSADPSLALWWYKHFVFLGVANIMPNFYLFSVATGGQLLQKRLGVMAGYISANLTYLVVLLMDSFITAPHLYYWGYYPHYEPAMVIFFVPYAILFLASEFNLWAAYKAETIPIKQKHILTIFIGLLIGFLASFDFIAKIWNIPLYPFGYIPSFILSAMVAYSVIRHKAFDIETVVHKTILWVASFLLIITPIFLLYRLSFVYIKDSWLNQALFGVASFFIYTLYLRMIQPKVDHFFQRRKADLEAISNNFVAELVYLKGIDSLIRLMEVTLANALYPQWVDIFIFDEKKKGFCVVNRTQHLGRAAYFNADSDFLLWLKDNNRIAYREFIEIDPAYTEIKESARGYFKNSEAMVAIPLVLSEELLGVINLDKKANLERYKAVDFDFLTTLKNQAAIALSNSLMYQNIEQQVKDRTQELVEVQKQLIQAEKLATVGTLSGGVAHEINNPLTAILTNVQMLLALSDDKGAVMDKESLEMIEEATQRCRGIVQKLMAYAKKPLEKDELAETDLSQVLDKTIAFIGYQLQQDNIRLEIDKKDGTYMVLANANELEQVFTNIILNARDAINESGRNGQISINLYKDAGHVKVEIKDNGVGIASDKLSKIFDPFFTTKDVGKGLGLGLSICQSIVEKYEGRMFVKSDMGKGTIFELRIPECLNNVEFEKNSNIKLKKNIINTRSRNG